MFTLQLVHISHYFHHMAQLFSLPTGDSRALSLTVGGGFEKDFQKLNNFLASALTLNPVVFMRNTPHTPLTQNINLDDQVEQYYSRTT